MITFEAPNFYSGPTIKVWVMKFFLETNPNYRLDTGYFYKNKVLIDLVMSIAKDEGKILIG